MWEKLFLLTKVLEFKFIRSAREFTLKANFHCETSLKFVITCHGCKEEYIGQTRGQLKNRLHIHWEHIWQPEY